MLKEILDGLDFYGIKPIKNIGYLDSKLSNKNQGGMASMSLSSSVTFYGDDGNSWVKDIPFGEAVLIYAGNKDIIVVGHSKPSASEKGKKSKGFRAMQNNKFFLSIWDTKSGDLLFEKEASEFQNIGLPKLVSTNNNGNIKLSGLYFDPTLNVRGSGNKGLPMSSSEGVFTLTLSGDGDILEEKYIKWDENSFNNSNFYIQDYFLHNDEIVIITELFEVIDKDAKVKDFKIFKIDESFTAINEELVTMPELIHKKIYSSYAGGLSFQSTGKKIDEALPIVWKKGFRHQATTTTNDEFNILYHYHDEDKEEHYVGNIKSKNGEYKDAQFPIIDSKNSNISVYQAKPGYILIVEYWKKEKKLDVRLEKFDY